MASWYRRPAHRPREFRNGLMIGVAAASVVSWLVALVVWKEWL